MKKTNEATVHAGRSMPTALAAAAACALGLGCGARADDDASTSAAETTASAVSTIVDVSSGLCVDVPGSSSAPRLALQAYACNATAAQTFSFASTSVGTYILQTSHGLCVQASGGGRVTQNRCSGSLSQTWNVTAGAGGAYAIASASTQRCLVIANDSSDSGAALVTSTCTNGSDQLFALAGFTASSGSLAFGQPCTASACTYDGAVENVAAAIRCEAGTLAITRATYGQPGFTEDCTAYVNAQCAGLASCSIDLTNTSCGGDPDYGVLKTGSVTVACSATGVTPDAGAPSTGTDAGSPTTGTDAGAPTTGTDAGTGTGTTVSPPAQAVAAGFSTLAFDDEFTTASIGTGSSAATYNWYATVPTSDYSVAGGVLTISNDISGCGDDISSVNFDDDGHIFQHAYFEASMAFDPDGYSGAGAWPAFWSWAVEGDTSAANTPFTELDFMEAYPATPGTAGGGVGYITTLHQHTYTSAGALTDVANSNNYPGISADFTQFHRYGCLWEPGKVTWYLDDVAGETVMTGASTPFTSIDGDHLFLTLGTGTNWPTKFDYVRVWAQ